MVQVIYIYVSVKRIKCHAPSKGGTGDDLRDTFRYLLREDLCFPHIRILYPTAPVRPYSLADGMPSSVWFDRVNLGLNSVEQKISTDAMAKQLGQLVDAEVKSGIPLHRIVIGGFSMGGAMALHLGYRFHKKIAGVIAIGSFLPNDSAVYQDLEQVKAADTTLPLLTQIHGEADELVNFLWGRNTFDRLCSLGVKGEFTAVPNLGHFLNRTVTISLREKILKLLPEEHSL
ncbi:lysophospholipase-like protein 1 isoform X2 [Pomacea canaliculata]|uniref:lysophospholipase-like protein 1 isoform X2 n=1 Tax=Pomacea canaliculata TaxID=400727 RepID=UPI000D73F1EC|nr:lysophospholipase-like protein 1 isoform X2 [Pomacea canaliculata]